MSFTVINEYFILEQKSGRVISPQKIFKHDQKKSEKFRQGYQQAKKETIYRREQYFLVGDPHERQCSYA